MPGLDLGLSRTEVIMAVLGLLKLACALVMFNTMTRVCYAASPNGYCPSRTCGIGGVSVKYPFALQDDPAAARCYSKYPDLQFQCSNASLYVNFTSNSTYFDDMYKVIDINYYYQTLSLVPFGSSICRSFDANRFGGLNITNTTTLLLDCEKAIPGQVCYSVGGYSSTCDSNPSGVAQLAVRWGCEMMLNQSRNDSYHSCHLVDTRFPNFPDSAATTVLLLQFEANRTISFLNETGGPASSPAPAPAPLSGSGDKSSKKKRLYIILGAVLGLLAAMAILLFCMLFWWRQSRHTSSRATERITRKNMEALGKMKDFNLPLRDRNHPTTFYTLKELERATNNFSDDCKLGSGGYGTVYRGTFDNGVEVAIKRTNCTVDMKGISEQFMNEVILLSHVNHRNLVRLLGCCLEVEVPMLVYEYVSNGDLFQHLHGERCPGTHLSWEKRLQIAIDSAEALSYLHSAAHPPIYHRDVKSSNILLDDKFNVRVADFGISRLVKPDATHISTAVQGTVGYLDPQYFRTFQLTDKSDVYSFGMVLLELVTSLKPVDFRRGGEAVNLITMAWPFIQEGNVMAIADARLLDKNAYASLDDLADQMQRVAELASKCLADSRHHRPTMKEVVAELVAIRGVESRVGRNSSGMDGMDYEGAEMAPVLGNQSFNFKSSSDSSNTRYSDQSPLVSDEVKCKTR